MPLIATVTDPWYECCVCVPFGLVKSTVRVSGVGGRVAVAVGLVAVGDDEVIVVAVAVDPGVPATLEAGVCDDLTLGVLDRFGVEVRDATSDPSCAVWVPPAL